MNERSSRSHTIFTLTIESRIRDGEDETVKVASLVGGGSILHNSRTEYSYIHVHVQCSPQPKLKAYWEGIFWVGLVSTSEALTPPQSRIKDKLALKG